MVYFKRMLKFRHMDFEFAFWQMFLLLSSPQKVYKNFHYQKQTKHHWARDDPAFLVILSGFLLISSIVFTFVLGLGIVGFIRFLLWVVLIDCVGIGLVLSTIMWFLSNKFFKVSSVEGGNDQRVEWAYAFDVHLNSFFPLMVLLHGVQLILWWFLTHNSIFSAILSNLLWYFAIGYYIYISFLGYSILPFLRGTVYLLYSFLPLTILVIISIPMNWNFTVLWGQFYTRL
jgi:hypothetical protein